MDGSSESGSFEPEVQIRERTRERRQVEQEVEKSLRMSRKFDKSSSFATDNSCSRCKRNVFAIERLQVEGVVFHSGCFTCSSCPTELTPNAYHRHDGLFYCTQHYLGATKGRTTRSPTIGTPRADETPRSEICTSCGRRVIHFEKIEVNGNLFHRPCFACSTCREPLDLDAYEEVDGKFFCTLHFVQSKQRSPGKLSKKEEKKLKKEEKKAKRNSITGSPNGRPPVEASPEPEKRKKKGLLSQLSRGRKENKDAISELNLQESNSKAAVLDSLNAAELDSSATPARSLSSKSSDDSSKDTMELIAPPADFPPIEQPQEASRVPESNVEAEDIHVEEPVSVKQEDSEPEIASEPLPEAAENPLEHGKDEEASTQSRDDQPESSAGLDSQPAIVGDVPHPAQAAPLGDDPAEDNVAVPGAQAGRDIGSDSVENEDGEGAASEGQGTAPSEHTGDSQLHSERSGVPEVSAEPSAGDANTVSVTEEATEASVSDMSSPTKGKKSKSSKSKKGKKEKKEKRSKRDKDGARTRSDSTGSVDAPKLKKGRSGLRFRLFGKKTKEDAGAVPTSKSVGAVPSKSHKKKDKEKKEKSKKKSRHSKKKEEVAEDQLSEEVCGDAPEETDTAVVVVDDAKQAVEGGLDPELAAVEDKAAASEEVAALSGDEAAGDQAADVIGDHDDGSIRSIGEDQAKDAEEMPQDNSAVAADAVAIADGSPDDGLVGQEHLDSAQDEEVKAEEQDRLSEDPVQLNEDGAQQIAPAVVGAVDGHKAQVENSNDIPPVDGQEKAAPESNVEIAPEDSQAQDNQGEVEDIPADAVAAPLPGDDGFVEAPGEGSQVVARSPQSDQDASHEAGTTEDLAINAGQPASSAESPHAGDDGMIVPQGEESRSVGGSQADEDASQELDIAPPPVAEPAGEVGSDEEKQQFERSKRRRSIVHTFTSLLKGGKAAEDTHALKSPRGGRTKRRKGKQVGEEGKAEEPEGSASDEGGLGRAQSTPDPKRKGRSRMKFLRSAKSSKMKDDLKRNQTVASVEHSGEGSAAALPAAQSTSSLGSFAKKLRRSKKDLQKNQVEHEADRVPVPSRMKSDMTVKTKEQAKLSKKERKALEKEEKAAAKAQKAREKAEKAALKAGHAMAPPPATAPATTVSAASAPVSDDKEPLSSDVGEGERDDIKSDTDPDVPDPDDMDEGKPAEIVTGRQRAASTLHEQIALEGESASNTLESENAKALMAMKKAEATLPRSPFVDFAGSLQVPASFVKPMALPACLDSDIDACAGEELDDEGEDAPKGEEFGLAASLAKRKQKKADDLAALTPEERVKFDIMKNGYFKEKCFKIGVVGLSNRLFGLLSALFSAFPRRIELAGVFESDSTMFQRAQERFGENVKQYSTLADAVSDSDIKWVLVGSLPKDHHTHITAAFAAGKNVFCENPHGLNVKDTANIYRAYRQSKCHFVTGQVQRSNPFYDDIYNLVRSGVIGKVVSVEANETLLPGEGGFLMSSAFGSRAQAGPPLLERQHDLDIISWIVGSSPARVAAFGGLSVYKPENKPPPSAAGLYGEWDKRPASVPHSDPFTSQKDIEDNQVVIIEYLNNVRATFHSNFNSALPQRRLLVCGLKGTIEGDLLAGHVRFKTIGGDATETVRQHTPGAAHGGGDQRLMNHLMDVMSAESEDAAMAKSCAAPQQSLVSSLTALSVDKARAERKVVELAGLGVDYGGLGVDLATTFEP